MSPVLTPLTDQLARYLSESKLDAAAQLASALLATAEGAEPATTLARAAGELMAVRGQLPTRFERAFRQTLIRRLTGVPSDELPQTLRELVRADPGGATVANAVLGRAPTLRGFAEGVLDAEVAESSRSATVGPGAVAAGGAGALTVVLLVIRLALKLGAHNSHDRGLDAYRSPSEETLLRQMEAAEANAIAREVPPELIGLSRPDPRGFVSQTRLGAVSAAALVLAEVRPREPEPCGVGWATTRLVTERGDDLGSAFGFASVDEKGTERWEGESMRGAARCFFLFEVEGPLTSAAVGRRRMSVYKPLNAAPTAITLLGPFTTTVKGLIKLGRAEERERWGVLVEYRNLDFNARDQEPDVILEGRLGGVPADAELEARVWLDAKHAIADVRSHDGELVLVMTAEAGFVPTGAVDLRAEKANRKLPPPGVLPEPTRKALASMLVRGSTGSR